MSSQMARSEKPVPEHVAQPDHHQGWSPWLLGVYLLALTLLGICASIQIWPVVESAPSSTAVAGTESQSVTAADAGDRTGNAGEQSDEEAPAVEAASVSVLGAKLNLTPSQATLVLVGVLGVVGASLDALRNLASFVGLGTFRSSWSLWYVLRPVIGLVLAVVVYIALVAGLIGLSDPTQSINAWGAAAVGALTGLFAKDALVKLAEVARTLFGAKAEPQQVGGEGTADGGGLAPAKPMVDGS